MERRTEEAVRRLAIEKGLRVGARVRITKMVQASNGRRERKFMGQGVVTALYGCIFACEIGGQTECFRYNEAAGYESTQVTLI